MAMKKEMVYIVIELAKDKTPRIVSVHKTRKAAEKEAYADGTAWRNVVEKELVG